MSVITCPVLAIELLGSAPELDHEIARQVLRFDLAALLSPQPHQGVVVITHDDPGVGAADKEAAVYSVDFELCEMIWHDDPSALVLTLDCGIGTCDNSTIQMPVTSAQVRMARAALNWSVRDLAAAARIHRNTVTNIETGRYAGDAATLAAIVSALKRAGVEFIDENGGGVGVRLRKGQHRKD